NPPDYPSVFEFLFWPRPPRRIQANPGHRSSSEWQLFVNKLSPIRTVRVCSSRILQTYFIRACGWVDHINGGFNASHFQIPPANRTREIRYCLVADEVNSTATETTTRHARSQNSVLLHCQSNHSVKFRTTYFVIIAQRVM